MAVRPARKSDPARKILMPRIAAARKDRGRQQIPPAEDRNKRYNIECDNNTRDYRAMKHPPEIERGWGFLLKDVSRLHVKRFEQRARLLGLTLPECRVLIYLSHEEGVTQVRLGALTDIEPMTLVRMLDRMEADGWLERRSNPTDRRTRHIHAKPKGRALMNEIAQLVVLTRDECLAGVPKKNVDLLMSMLEKIRGNLLALEPIATPADALPRRSLATRRKVGT
jgi:MarR family transcriptional regulator, transcriptional regulator for hemolysin